EVAEAARQFRIEGRGVERQQARREFGSLAPDDRGTMDAESFALAARFIGIAHRQDRERSRRQEALMCNPAMGALMRGDTNDRGLLVAPLADGDAGVASQLGITTIGRDDHRSPKPPAIL